MEQTEIIKAQRLGEIRQLVFDGYNSIKFVRDQLTTNFIYPVTSEYGFNFSWDEKDDFYRKVGRSMKLLEIEGTNFMKIGFLAFNGRFPEDGIHKLFELTRKINIPSDSILDRNEDEKKFVFVQREPLQVFEDMDGPCAVYSRFGYILQEKLINA